MASPVESKSVVSISTRATGRRAAEDGAELGHVLAADLPAGDGAGKLAAR